MPTAQRFAPLEVTDRKIFRRGPGRTWTRALRHCQNQLNALTAIRMGSQRKKFRQRKEAVANRFGTGSLIGCAIVAPLTQA